VIDGFSSIAQFAEQMSGLTGGAITGQVIPYKVDPSPTPVGSVLTVDPATVQQFIKKLFSDEPPAPASSPSLTPSATTSTTPPAKRKPSCVD
jgi:hypothetical protein